MAGQGYPDEGGDHRLITGLGWLQRLTLVHSSKPKDVERIDKGKWHVKVQAWPPFILAEKQLAKGFRQIRLGWTWRENQHYYILGAGVKHEDSLLPDYANALDADEKR